MRGDSAHSLPPSVNAMLLPSSNARLACENLCDGPPTFPVFPLSVQLDASLLLDSPAVKPLDLPSCERVEGEGIGLIPCRMLLCDAPPTPRSTGICRVFPPDRVQSEASENAVDMPDIILSAYPGTYRRLAAALPPRDITLDGAPICLLYTSPSPRD